ncbi:MAG: hypothetical protein KDA85_20455 [Planctomycetaceae bacterium]|nr:hypothetical protein [Planctomycetaceae bacterium]
MSVPATKGPVRKPGPQIKVTRYDLATALLYATLFMVAVTFVMLVAIFLANLIPKKVTQPMQIFPAGDGGWEDGEPDATPNVESPEDPSDDPSLANDQSDVTELMEVTDQVVDLADTAAALVEPNSFTDAQDSGNPGSAVGTGGRPWGTGGGGRGGQKRDNRWFVRFADKSNIKTYAAQLDFFKIELGALFPEEQKVIYLSNLSAARPTVREAVGGENEKRLFMSWDKAAAERREGDLELFQKAGLDVGQATIVHFYPPETEQMLAQLEADYAGKAPNEIRRTSFDVINRGSGFEFKVTDQKYR